MKMSLGCPGWDHFGTISFKQSLSAGKTSSQTFQYIFVHAVVVHVVVLASEMRLLRIAASGVSIGNHQNKHTEQGSNSKEAILNGGFSHG